jgi:hypothetical protein
MSAGWAKQSCALTSQSQNHLERQPEKAEAIGLYWPVKLAGMPAR